MSRHAWAALLLACRWALAGAQAPEPQVVSVTGQVFRDLRPYSHYLPGLREFRAYHDLAPDADLRFGIVSGDNGKPLPLKHARMELDDRGVDLPMVEEGWFTIPGPEDDAHADANVVVSWRGSGVVTWTIDVHTAGLRYQVYRLGDLRLACRVYLAIEWAHWKGRRVKGVDQRPTASSRWSRALARQGMSADASMDASQAAQAGSLALEERILATQAANGRPPMDAACGGPVSVFMNIQPGPRLGAYVIREGGRTLRYVMNGWPINRKSFELDLAPAAGAPSWSDDAQVEFVFQDRSHWQTATAPAP